MTNDNQINGEYSVKQNASKSQNPSIPEDTEQRAVVYKLLADCYRPPDDMIHEDFETLKGLLCEPSQDIEPEPIEKVKVDHARLFIGPLELVAPPYGSIYLEGDGKLMTGSTENVLHWYGSEGMEVMMKDMPDHIRIELEFMYYMVYREFEAEDEAAEWQKKQQLFLKQHLSQWIKPFEKRVKKGTETRFYRELVEITSRFVLGDLELLEQNQN